MCMCPPNVSGLILSFPSCKGWATHFVFSMYRAGDRTYGVPSLYIPSTPLADPLNEALSFTHTPTSQTVAVYLSPYIVFLPLGRTSIFDSTPIALSRPLSCRSDHRCAPSSAFWSLLLRAAGRSPTHSPRRRSQWTRKSMIVLTQGTSYSCLPL